LAIVSWPKPQEREAATGDILRVIASSPNDLQSVLEVVAKNAARLCGAADAPIYRLDDMRGWFKACRAANIGSMN
jgi:hypothetical protein